jgi:hypothetical protein
MSIKIINYSNKVFYKMKITFFILRAIKYKNKLMKLKIQRIQND